MFVLPRQLHSLICAMGLLVVLVLAANAQNPVRRPVRQIDPQQGPPAEQPGQQGFGGNRQQLRKILGRTEQSTPVIDTQTGTFDMRRQTIARPPQRELQRVSSRWRLGVWTENGPRGLRVREVSRYSPGWRYGIEEGDYILDIMGYPVGYYEGDYYPLADTLNQVTPRDGWVNVLVWNKRTGAEESMWMRAEPRSEGGFGRSDESSE